MSVRWIPERRGRLAPALAACVALSATLLAREAAAVTVEAGQVTRTGTTRDTGHGPYDVSYADCIGNNDFEFVLSNLVIGDNLSVWVTGSGSDCTSLQQRDLGNCVQIYAESAVSQTSVTLGLGAAAIAGAMSGVTACVDSGANTDPRVAKLYFMVGASTVDPVVDFDVYTTNVDLLGPNPTSLAIEDAQPAGESSVVVDWAVPTDLSDVQGYQVYCEKAGPALASGGTGGGGGGGGAVGGSGGSSTGTGGAAGCSAPNLTPGEVPSAAFACGSSVAANTGTGTVEGLETGVLYAFGVSGHDLVSNEGKLTELRCATPQPVDEFFKLYRDAGGQAGGCRLADPAGGLTGLGALAGLAGLALGLRRARRRA
ncbi:MAG: hypothetical protein HY908_21470 [Myxococcales bacterium]|nr:hypothetical protein [Myxococcales bacterium]